MARISEGRARRVTDRGPVMRLARTDGALGRRSSSCCFDIGETGPPQARCVDQERIPMRPVLAIAYGLVEPVQGGSIQFLCSIAATRDVEDNAYANQIHASCVRYGRGLVVDDADDDSPGLGTSQVRRVAGRVTSGTQDVEFR